MCWATATELPDAVRGGSIAPTEIATVFADRIEAINLKLNAYIHFDREQVMADAMALQGERAAARSR